MSLSIIFAMLSFIAQANWYASASTRTYIVHVDSTRAAAQDASLAGAKGWAEAMLDSLAPKATADAPAPTPQLLYVYDTAFSGFAARLSDEQAEHLRRLDDVLMVGPDELLHLHTTHTPEFLGLQPGKGLWSSPTVASNTVIGVIDTGIWPEHVSFTDDGFPDVSAGRWKGACKTGRGFSARNCNRKLVGARAYWKGYEAVGGKINETEYKSARDSEGHGTHTASTAAGSSVADANLLGFANGTARGMSFSARVAVYKACWEGGCASSDILAAMDQAVADGVDVLSLSLGGGLLLPYYMDKIAIAALGAVSRGVFVTCSAGNYGPYTSSVLNAAPWIMTVAASYHDRRFPTSVKLGNGLTFEGGSLYSGAPTGFLSIVYGETAGGQSARYCVPGSLSAKKVKGKMVLCDAGEVGRTKKGEQVKIAGGAAMLLLNSKLQGDELFADAHVLPASSLGAAATEAVRNYSASAKSPTAMITFLGTAYGRPAPAITAFSSRGPSVVDPNVIKPDVTAPGMSILAAWPPTASPSLLESDQRRVDFNIISGTSMSCPHVSGLAALLKSAHPDWSPAAIKSALMTTAYTVNNQNSGIIDVSTGQPATPFSMGSGHVDPEKAATPGLIYDIAPEDYLNYLCSLNYTSEQLATLARKKVKCPKNGVPRAEDLNYPSFSVLFDGKGKKKGTSMHSRTVTNVGQTQCRYTANVREPKGVKIAVKPMELAFVKIGQKLNFTVIFSNLGTGKKESSSFGELVWVCGGFSVRSPIAVTWQ